MSITIKWCFSMNEHSAAPTPATFGLAKAAYTVNETLNLLSIGRTSLYALIGQGQIRPIKFGKRTLIGADDIAALLDRNRRTAA